MTTSFQFYEEDPADAAAYGKPHILRYPDGNWEVRQYDHDLYIGALQHVLRPANGLPLNPADATPSNCEAATYSYLSGSTATVEHKIGGDSGLFMRDYVGTLAEGSLETYSDERYTDGLGRYGSGHPMGLVTKRGSESLGKGLAGHEFYYDDSKGPNKVMYYQGGIFDTNSGNFTVNSNGAVAGPDWRGSALTWFDYFELNQNGWPDEWVGVDQVDGESLYTGSVVLRTWRSTRESTVFHNGSKAALEVAVFTGLDETQNPTFEAFQRYLYKNDSLGHLTKDSKR